MSEGAFLLSLAYEDSLAMISKFYMCEIIQYECHLQHLLGRGDAD